MTANDCAMMLIVEQSNAIIDEETSAWNCFWEIANDLRADCTEIVADFEAEAHELLWNANTIPWIGIVERLDLA